MKVLIVNSGGLSDQYGGGQVYVRNLVNEMTNQNIHIDILAASVIPEENNQVSLVRLNTFEIREYRIFSNPVSNNHSLTISRIRQFLRDINPQIVHAHALKAEVSEACMREKIPCIVTAHHGGIVCPKGSLLNQYDEICSIKMSQSGCLPCLLNNIRLGTQFYPFYRILPEVLRSALSRMVIHLPFIPFLTPWLSSPLLINKKIKEWNLISRSSSAVIAPSAGIADAMKRNEIPQQKIHILPHGIPLASKQPISKDITYRPINFFYLGRINYVKGLHHLLKAFSNLTKNAELHIIGEAITKDEKRYKAKVKNRFDSKRITWHGNISSSHVFERICQYDVMIHPAIFLEVFGLTIAESLSSGRPVIATRCGGPEMQIEDGVNGFLVPANDADALRERMQYLADNPEEITRLAGNIRQPTSIRQHVNDLLEIYNNIISTKI